MRALTDLENIVNSSLGTNDVDSVHRLGQERQLRNELTILLLSYINNINDFAQDNFQWEAEERMNNLILHLWKTDTIRLEAKFGDTFARMNTSLKTWMDMRQRLERLRVGIGYLGAPGDDWKNHLNRMVYATRANAVIALTNMRKLQSVADAAWDQETFDNDLAVIFDELTQIIGCNGAEEFGALRLYNQTLFDWFR